MSDYKNLTIGSAVVAEESAVECVLAGVTTELGTLTAQLEQIEDMRQGPKQTRTETIAERDAAATNADLERTAAAEAKLAALASIDARQEVIRDGLEARRTAILAEQVPPAEAAAEAARQAHRTFSEKQAGQVPRGLVDWAIMQRVRQYAAEGLADGETAEDFVAVLGFLPDRLAAQVAADPGRFESERDEANSPSRSASGTRAARPSVSSRGGTRAPWGPVAVPPRSTTGPVRGSDQTPSGTWPPAGPGRELVRSSAAPSARVACHSPLVTTEA
ncbi:hypothetical protein [Sinomonas soli]